MYRVLRNQEAALDLLSLASELTMSFMPHSSGPEQVTGPAQILPLDDSSYKVTLQRGRIQEGQIIVAIFVFNLPQ